jgi:hypothetical protein
MARRARVPRVGILVECGRDGLEVHLCQRICELLRTEHGAAFAETIVPMDDKRRLVEECATVTAALFEEGFERIVILWDEEPAWPKKEDPLCWHQERVQILAALHGAGLPPPSVHLVCIERAFESWLMHDDRLLSRQLSRPTHKVKVKTPANPHRLNNAKGVLMRLFKKHGGEYRDVTLARQLAANLESLNRLRRCATFSRFAERVCGRPI